VRYGRRKYCTYKCLTQTLDGTGTAPVHLSLSHFFLPIVLSAVYSANSLFGISVLAAPRLIVGLVVMDAFAAWQCST
jgi:hypothetical protein